MKECVRFHLNRIKNAIQEVRWYIMLSILLFTIGGGLGTVDVLRDPPEPDENSSTLSENAEIPSAIYFASNNIAVTLLLLSGVAFFGTTTAFVLIFNGYLLTRLVVTGILMGGTAREAVLLILPHWLFEFPGLIIAGSVGFFVPAELVFYFSGKNNRILDEEQQLRVLYLISISMSCIIIAAYIEAHVTPIIYETFS